MPHNFTCPHCGQKTLVDDHLVGQSGPCATCGKTITVPYVVGVTPLPSSATNPTHPATVTTLPQQARGVSVGVITAIVLACLFCLVAVTGLLFALVMPAVNVASRNAAQARSTINLQRIASALNAYADHYGTYPPAYIADENGRPIHSWRVLILPFLGAQKIYYQYDFSQPWDSIANTALTYQMPEVYACPADNNAVRLNESSYMVIVGQRTMFPHDGCVAREEITDGLDSTIMVAEVESAGASWLEPMDLDAKMMQFQINGFAGQEIGSVFRRGAHVATADGQVHFLRNSTLPEHVETMTTIDGGEKVPPQF